jgi:hypothetical protein
MPFTVGKPVACMPVVRTVLNLIKSWNIHGGDSPAFLGGWPNGQTPPLCGTRSSLPVRVPFQVMRTAELLVVETTRSEAE